MTNWERSMPAVLLLVGLLAVTSYMRTDIAAFVEIAASLRFGFQLMLGATALAILRNEGGLSMFGVFGPVILAFAWLTLGPFWGFLLVAYVFVVTASARVSLSGLDLGTPHRVAALLVVASVAVFVMDAVGRLQGIPAFQTLLIFPVILTTWYAERFISQVDGEGWAPAGRRLAITVVGVIVAYLVAAYDPLVTAVVRTPESWVALVALNVVLGSRTNTRLGEYLRFRTLRRALGAENAGEVLTMRVRNRDFISRYNPGAIMSTFDKERMKSTLHGLDVPTPRTFFVVDRDQDLAKLRTLLDERDRLVLKPVDGSGGQDVLVVRGRTDGGDAFETNRGVLTASEIVAHARRVCVGGLADYGARSRVLVEGAVTPDGLLADRVGAGVPDLRVITLHGIPVMAMARLPTAESMGTANIHAGAVGVAVGIATGEATGGFQQTRNRYLEAHPDTGGSLSFAIPEWEAVLTNASRAAIASGLGYAGVDIVFDAEEGPVVLEVNRRPGLGIQNANMSGLLKRLRFVETEGDEDRFRSAKDRVRHAVTWARDDWEQLPTANPAGTGAKMEVSR